MTAREQAELSLIESNIKLDLETATTTFQYPVIGDLSNLSDNRVQVVAIESKVESRLLKKGILEEYNKEMRGYIERKVFVELEEDEMKSWDGPINYISHHDVLKPASISTKLRIVSNSSLNNNNSGTSYNDCLPKGPNSLVPLIEALVTWRQYPRVAVWDYSKCYNSVHTTVNEKHMRRFVWRFNTNEDWRTFAVD